MLGGGAGLAIGDVFDGGGVTFDVTVGGASSRGGEGEREGGRESDGIYGYALSRVLLSFPYEVVYKRS